MISFYVDTPERAKKILEGISLIQFAESLGGAESLMTYPRTQTHADLTPEEAKEKGITDTLLRFSVGLEDVEDLKEDLLSVFKISKTVSGLLPAIWGGSSFSYLASIQIRGNSVKYPKP